MKKLSLCVAAIALIAGSATAAVAQDYRHGDRTTDTRQDDRDHDRNGDSRRDDRGDRGRGDDRGEHGGWGHDRGEHRGWGQDRGDRGRGYDQGMHRGWGHDRGNGYRWRRGERMGYNDWNRASRVDYRRYHLRQPPRGYEWRQQNDQFILGAIASGVIASIILNNGR